MELLSQLIMSCGSAGIRAAPASDPDASVRVGYLARYTLFSTARITRYFLVIVAVQRLAHFFRELSVEGVE